MPLPNSFALARTCSGRLLALALASAVCTPVLATELKFTQQGDFTRNFAKPTVKDSLSVEKESGGVLRFSSEKGPRLVRTAFAPGEKLANVVDETITARFRFKGPNASFGTMMRVQKDQSDCYVALVNIGLNGGTVRLFKGLPTDSYGQGALVTGRSPSLKPGEWYRLEVSVMNKQAGVAIKAEVKPGSGGRALMTAVYDDNLHPLSNPGHVQLRFFAAEAGNEIDVKEVEIKPDPK